MRIPIAAALLLLSLSAVPAVAETLEVRPPGSVGEPGLVVRQPPPPNRQAQPATSGTLNTTLPPESGGSAGASPRLGPGLNAAPAGTERWSGGSVPGASVTRTGQGEGVEDAERPSGTLTVKGPPAPLEDLQEAPPPEPVEEIIDTVEDQEGVDESTEGETP
jgi:hypothetical protein